MTTGRGARTTAATALALAVALVPVYLFSALSGRLRADLGFGETAVGAAVTAFFLSSALTAVPAGHLVGRIGPRRALLGGATISSLVCAAIGLGAQTWGHVAALLAVAGAGVGLVDSGGARAFVEEVPDDRQGLAFGVKEASGAPGASLLAGVALPTLALTVGWRTTFVVSVALAPVVWLLLAPRREEGAPPPAPTATTTTRPRLGLFTVGVAAATAAANSAVAFLVPSTSGTDLLAPGPAGFLLAVASAASITTRLVAGWTADRVRRSRLPTIAGLMAVGALGLGLLAAGDSNRLVTVVGAVVAVGAGWGWTGLAFLVATRAAPRAAGPAAGTVLVGLASGGALGPLAFGWLVETFSFPAAWTAATAVMAVGAAITRASHRRAASGDPAR